MTLLEIVAAVVAFVLEVGVVWGLVSLGEATSNLLLKTQDWGLAFAGFWVLVILITLYILQFFRFNKCPICSKKVRRIDGICDCERGVTDPMDYSDHISMIG